MSLGHQPSADSAQPEQSSTQASQNVDTASHTTLLRNRIGDAYPTLSVTLPATQTHALQLTQFIRGQVIPRLAQAHGLAVSIPNATMSAPIVPAAPSAKDVSDFADLAFQTDSATVVARVEALVASGVSMDRVYLDWVAPAARQLGCDWDTDRANFSESLLLMNRSKLAGGIGRLKRYP